MTNFFPFYDIVGANASHVPLVKGTLVAYYNTGSGIVPETQAQINAAKAAGMGVVLIDQAPGNPLFAQGLSDVSDYESGAQTLTDVINGVRAREAHGWQSTIYVSYSALGALESSLRSAGCNMALVYFGVADYSWSVAQAEILLRANSNWAYVQYGDPNSNPSTLIPGTSMTLSQANADIDVANATWAAQFMPKPPTAPVVTGLKISTANTFATKGYITGSLTWNTVPGAGSYQGEIFNVATKALVQQFQVNTNAVADISLVWGTEYNCRVRVHPSAEWPEPSWGTTAYFTTPNA